MFNSSACKEFNHIGSVLDVVVDEDYETIEF